MMNSKKNKVVKTSANFSLLALLVGCFLFAIPSAQATHIVGGDLTYKILSKTQNTITVELTLSVYRDCINGADDAPFDNPAHIGIFNQANLLVQDFTIPFTGQDDTLSSQLLNPCLVNLVPVCVHTTLYKGTVTLPIIAGGYTFAYQRCCRNVTLLNIDEPLQTGATFLVRLRDDAIARANNSPVFKQWPPVYICEDQPLVFDHGAVDTINNENDSLVYKLCTPFAGGTLTDPRPIPTNPPPYDTIIWSSGYSIDNMLGFGPALRINRNTGVMMATPAAPGQYVVGVCVEEYDRETGELLSVIRRDFQYNVNPCGERTAAFVVPEEQCDNLTVTFENTSQNASTYQWSFPGAVNGLTSTSTDTFLTRTYPDTGTYTVTLIAEPNTPCADTATSVFRLVPNTIEADFFISPFDCDDFAILELSDFSTDSVGTITDYEWTVAYGTTVQTLSGSEVRIEVPLDVTGTVTLQVQSASGCIQSISKPFTTGLDNPGSLVLGDLTACPGQAFFLNPGTPDSIAFDYQWSPAELVSDPNAVNPMATITQPTTFSVTITPSGAICQIVKTVTVTLGEQPVAGFSSLIGCGGSTVDFSNTSTNAISYFWDFGIGESTEENPSFSFPGLGDYEVKLIATSADGCVDSLTQTLSLTDISLSADFGVVYQDCTPDGVTFQLLDQSTNAANNTSGYSWTLSTGQTSTDQNPIFTISGSGTIEVTFTVVTAANCTATVTKEVTIGVQPPTDQFPDQVAVCLGDSYTFDPGGDPGFSYVWDPNVEIDDNTSPAPTITPTQNRTYTVLVGSNNLDLCAVTETVEVIVIDPAVTSLAFTVQEECDGATFTFTNTSTGTAGYLWDFGNGETSTETNPVYTYPEPGTYTVTLSTIYDVDCIPSAFAEVEATEGTVTAAFSADIPDCANGSATVQFTNESTNSFNNGLSYSWTFSNGTPAGSTEENPLVTVTTAGPLVATLTARSGNGCEVTTSDTIEVSFIAISLADTIYLCPGENAELNPDGDPDLIYNWTPATGLSSATEANPIADPAVTTTYIVTVSTANTAGPVCTVSDTVTVVRTEGLADFAITVEEDGSSVQVDNVITTCADAVGLNSGLDGATVVWTTSGGAPVGTGASIDYPVSGTDTLLVSVADAFGCTATATVVIVDARARIELPEEQPLCPGDTVALNPGGNPEWTYVWTPITGLDDPTAPNPNATPTETTTYTVVVSNVLNGLTCTATAMTTVVVAPSLAGFDIDLTTTGGNNGGSVIGPDGVVTTCEPELDLTSGLAAGSNVEVTWTDPAGNVLGTGVTLMNLATAGRDTIIATAFDPDSGCPPVADTIVLAPNLVMIDLPPTIDTCPGDTVALNPDGNPDFSYSWTPIGSTEANPVVMPEQTTTYNVTVSNTVNGLTCTDEGMVTVAVAQPPGLDIGNDGPGQGPPIITCGEDVTLSGNFPPGTDPILISWTSAEQGDLGQSETITVNPFQTDTIIASAEYGPGCVEMDTIVIIDNGVDVEAPGPIQTCEGNDTLLTVINLDPDDVLSYLWSPAQVIVGPRNEMSATILLPESGTFEVSVTVSNQKNCDTTIVIPVTVEEFNPSGLPNETVEACAGAPTELNPGGNQGLEWNWTPQTGLDLSDPFNPVVTTDENRTYTYTATDPATECSASGTVTVNVQAPPALETGEDLVDCEGSVDLTATTDGGATLAWYDNPDGTGEPLGTGSPFPVSPPLGTTTYYVIATNAANCPSLDSVTVNSNPLNAMLTPPQVFCEPTESTEVVLSGLQEGEEYDISWSSAELSGLGGAVSLTLGTNEYSVTVTNALGCEQVLSTTVDVVDLSGLTGIAEPPSISLGETSVLTVIGCEDCGYEWFPPTGTVSPTDAASVTATPDDSGDWIYEVDVTKLGCSNTVEIPLTVTIVDCVPDRVYLPNAFTPNGDNNNDVLRLRSNFLNEIIDMELIVYNRWGEQVFYTTDPSQGWDGTFKGALVGPDVYGYWLRVVCPNEEELIQKGNVTVIR